MRQNNFIYRPCQDLPPRLAIASGPPEWRQAVALTTLRQLWRDLERPPTVRDLAAALACNPARAHRLLKGLEDAGDVVYVGRAACPAELAERLRAAMLADDGGGQ